MKNVLLGLGFLIGCSMLLSANEPIKLESNNLDRPAREASMLFFQKGKLNDKIMQFDMDPLQTKLEQHIYQIREGSPGGFDTSGGSCGCN